MYDVNQSHDPKMVAYEAEVKRARGQYGPGAELPDPPKGYTGLREGRLGTPTAPIGRQPVAARIEDLARQITVAGHQVTETRLAFDVAAQDRSKAEQRFSELAAALMQAIHEHREGTPENVPYQP